MAIKAIPDVAVIRELLDFTDGVFTWRPRPRGYFRSEHEFRRWNTRFSRKTAGTVDSSGYVRIRFGNEYHRAHRLVWLLAHGIPVPDEIDHVNGVKSDNRPENLRKATRIENGANSRMRADNKTGFRGVFQVRDGLFRAKININRRQIHLGYFSTVEEAAAARREGATRLMGAFARHT